MTFLPKNITPIKVDVLRINAQSISSTPITMNLSGSLNNTRATFDSSTYQITLPEGSHWRLVFQCGQYTFASNAPSYLLKSERSSVHLLLPKTTKLIFSNTQ